MFPTKKNRVVLREAGAERLRLPEWFRATGGKGRANLTLNTMLGESAPSSICQEAHCPNRGECWAKGVLTFMILGDTCTRTCGFCSVKFGKPLPPDKNEIQKILHAIEKLNLRFVVLTSPNRDDLPDAGSGFYADAVSEIKRNFPKVKVEVLIPDFQGKRDLLEKMMAGNPDVINHNIETVSALYPSVRRGSVYRRSLDLLKTVKAIDATAVTKTGIMLGLGETEEEITQAFADIAEMKIDILTLGQYLKSHKNNLDVVRYYHPDEFVKMKELAEAAGIRYVFSGPMVRSSYLAENVYEDLLLPRLQSTSAEV